MNLSDQLISFFTYVGSLVCHQLPERSLQVGGQYFPVCARCMGIYLGFYIGYSMLHFRNRKSNGPPNLWITLFMILPTIVDGTGQWLGFWTSINNIRLFAGLLFGTSVAPFIIYLLSILPTSKKLPVIRNVLPTKIELDDVRNPWLGYRAYAIGLVEATILFFIISALSDIVNIVLYFSISFLIMISIFSYLIVLPIFILSAIVGMIIPH